MHRRRRAHPWLLAAALLHAAPAAFAQQAQPTPPPAQDPNVVQVSRQLFQDGVAALQARRFEAALLVFQRAYALRPSPVLLYNLGLAYQGSGQMALAVEHFERYLEAPEQGAQPSRLEALRQLISQLRAPLASLTVTCDPPGATVSVDGTPRAPRNGAILVDPGPHVVEARAEGHRSQTQSVTAAANGHLSLDFRLETGDAAPRLEVVPTPATAVVFLDGQRLQAGSLDREITPGSHVVEVRADGYETYQHTVTIPRTGRTRLDPSLSRRASNAWVLPVVLGVSGALVVGGAVTLGVVLSRGTAEPVAGNWGVQFVALRFE